MNEITAFFTALLQVLSAGRDVMLVTVTESLGSAPRGAGARMLVDGGGRAAGTIGGGPVEYRAEKEAIGLLAQKRSAKVTYALSDASSLTGMICGGTVTAAFHFISASRDDIRELCRAALERLRTPGELWLILELPAPLTACPQDKNGGDRDRPNPPLYIGICGPDGKTVPAAPPGSLPDSLPAAPGLFEAGGRDFYLERIAADSLIHVFGGGHVARKLVPLLAETGFTCAVYDDRAEYVRQEDFPSAFGTSVISFDRLDGCLFPAAENYFVIMTRGHQFDLQAQAFAMGMPAIYIGVMGSRRKTAVLTDKLLELGFSREALNLVHAPIGLSIGAQTPAEIAVSIAAELIKVRKETINYPGGKN